MRVLLYYSQLNIGGAERSNIRLMQKMVEANWDVTLLLRYGGGTIESEIPKQVHIFYLRKNNTFIKNIANKSIAKKIIGYYSFLLAKLHEKKICGQLKKRTFDIAIIGLQGLDAKVIINNIDAKKRFLWIRNDLSLCDLYKKIANNINKNHKFIDYYPCVSKTAMNSFIEAFPHLKEKTILFYNIINSDTMLRAMNNPSITDGKYMDALKVLSVCRISDKSKGVFRMLDIYEKLRADGIFFYWLIAGDGDDLKELKLRVEAKGLQDGFILLGHQSNPFPLYKQSDIVAVLSYYEGLCGVVNEAKVVGRPVLATEFSGIHEQIINEDGGLIVENSFKGAYQGLQRLLTDHALRKKLTNNHLKEQIINDDYKLQLIKDIIVDKGDN